MQPVPWEVASTSPFQGPMKIYPRFLPAWQLYKYLSTRLSTRETGKAFRLNKFKVGCTPLNCFTSCMRSASIASLTFLWLLVLLLATEKQNCRSQNAKEYHDWMSYLYLTWSYLQAFWQGETFTFLLHGIMYPYCKSNCCFKSCRCSGDIIKAFTLCLYMVREILNSLITCNSLIMYLWGYIVS